MSHPRDKKLILGRSFVNLRAFVVALVETLRPRQWIKNTLLFVPVVATHQLDAAAFAVIAPAVMIFVLLSSTAYIFNDLLDLSFDREHPRKYARPLASGRLSSRSGLLLGLVLGALGLLLAAEINERFCIVAGLYFFLTCVYSALLKRMIVVDVLVLAILYDLRIVAGAEATSVAVSGWLMGLASFLFLALASIKRLNELVDARHRGLDHVLGRGYQDRNRSTLLIIGIASGTAASFSLCLYAQTDAAVALYSQPKALWGIGVVIMLWTIHMVSEASHGAIHDDPMVFIVRDRVSRVCITTVVLLAAFASL